MIEVCQSVNIYYVTICGFLFRLRKTLCFVVFISVFYCLCCSCLRQNYIFCYCSEEVSQQCIISTVFLSISSPINPFSSLLSSWWEINKCNQRLTAGAWMRILSIWHTCGGWHKDRQRDELMDRWSWTAKISCIYRFPFSIVMKALLFMQELPYK